MLGNDSSAFPHILLCPGWTWLSLCLGLPICVEDVSLRLLKSQGKGSCVQLFCDPMDCSLPGSSVHGIFQARGLEWGAIAFSDIMLEVY